MIRKFISIISPVFKIILSAIAIGENKTTYMALIIIIFVIFTDIFRFSIIIRSHLKNRILVQDQGGAEFQPADILKYFEDLKRRPNAEVGPKDIFEIASNKLK